MIALDQPAVIVHGQRHLKEPFSASGTSINFPPEHGQRGHRSVAGDSIVEFLDLSLRGGRAIVGFSKTRTTQQEINAPTRRIK